jgi:hypothetical protein
MKRLVVLCLWAILPACSGSEPLGTTLRISAPDVQPLHATLYSNILEERRILIRDAESWAALWPQMVSIGAPQTPPFVDFSKEDVLIAAMGERRVGGFQISVLEVQTVERNTQVVVRSTIPGPTCDRAEVISAPLDAVRIRKITGTLTFDERTLINACR